MPPTAPTSREPKGGTTDDQQVGPGEKTVSESSATPEGRPTSEHRGSKVDQPKPE